MIGALSPPLGQPLFSGFWLAQAADVLIVALVVRKLLSELLKTRALKITLLFVVIIGAGMALRALDFTIVGYLVSRVIPFAFLALVFLFHSEIRDVLSNLAIFLEEHIPFGRDRVWTQQNTIDTILETAKYLRRRQLGGLIVLERAESPKNLYEGGMKLDTRVSAELLGSILEPPGPLHDGAVIIKNDRIVGAAVILPLSTQEDYVAGKGTRHRAALGIAESSDAIAVVISEETGKFSLAADGVLESSLTSAVLRERLLALTGHSDGEEH
ncbi:diadenylate cyclase [Candidatus Fermentibacterales bacterium]|nr:diadenylate cyclase [Candidatus Fermentibacterales bacterium]